MKTAATIAATVLLLAPAAALAADAVLTIQGQIKHPQQLCAADLDKLPATRVHLSYQTGKGPEEATYEGPLLWAVLDKADPIHAEGKNAQLRHSVLVTASDGYAVTLSWGELAPDYENKRSFSPRKRMTSRSARPGSVSWLPNDKHGGRQVRDVVKIDVQ